MFGQFSVISIFRNISNAMCVLKSWVDAIVCLLVSWALCQPNHHTTNIFKENSTFFYKILLLESPCSFVRSFVRWLVTKKPRIIDLCIIHTCIHPHQRHVHHTNVHHTHMHQSQGLKIIDICIIHASCVHASCKHAKMHHAFMHHAYLHHAYLHYQHMYHV